MTDLGIVNAQIATAWAEGLKPHSDIHGHMERLRQAGRGNVLEIGVRAGASTSALLLGVEEYGGHVYSVDISEHCGGRFAGHPQWTFIHADSREAEKVRRLIPLSLDVLFVDGDHSFEVAKSDLENYGPLVKHGGMILMHDVELAGAGVRQALDEYAAALGLQPEFVTGSFGLGVLRV